MATTTTTTLRPPYDPGLVASATAPSPPTSEDAIAAGRIVIADMSRALNQQSFLGKPEYSVEDWKVAGRRGSVELTVVRLKDKAAAAGLQPAIFYIHGGGLVSGDRYTGLNVPVGWAKAHNAIVISVEYGLAPEHKNLELLEDCYDGLLWVGAHFSELNIDPARLLLAGHSAGGGLAAGLALYVRDHGGPKLAAQFLGTPMLDDRMRSVSARQFWSEPSGTNAGMLAEFWKHRLGERCGTDAVSSYEAPARATDLSNLPPTFLDVGSSEAFRDEVVAFATRLWEHGVDAELHVWPGGIHAFEMYAPTIRITTASEAAKVSWLSARLSPPAAAGETEHQ